MTTEFFYECTNCGKKYHEIRENDQQPWFTKCDICGNEYIETNRVEVPNV